MISHRLFSVATVAVAALAIGALAGCTAPALAPFSTPQTADDQLSGDAHFPAEAKVNADSIRFVGANGTRRYYVAQADSPPGGVCVLIDDQNGSGQSVGACGGPSGTTASSAALGSATFAAAGVSGEASDGWVQLADTVMVRPPDE